ncbi:MAG TPA: tripartite tricarboxylate transporter substrate-binding protein [Burkholderiaceae bacterium]|nr:tripartite tricarboxylate transporter substrate-binding protein [Burkholderiaceae bacterium]
MTTTRRHALIAIGAALAAAGAPAAWAQQAPIRIVVGFPAGGSIDTATRVVAEHMRATLGRPVIVENRPGAASRVALEAMKHAKPDGETLIASPSGPLTLFPHVYKNLRYDPLKDLTPISTIAAFDYAVTVGPATPAKTVAEYKRWAAANPDKANYGTTGAGTPAHFFAVSFAQRTGLQLSHVPYKGSGPAITDLAAGQISAVFSPVTEAASLHKAGRIRILATSGASRSELVPEVPTLKEAGVDFDLSSWFALFGPAGLPAEIVQAYAKAAAAAAADPAVAERLAAAGLRPSSTSPQQLEKLQRDETAMWGPVVKASGFSLEE